jgi:hypothetical protein
MHLLDMYTHDSAGITVFRLSEPPKELSSHSPPLHISKTNIRILPSMPLRVLRLKILKSLKIPTARSEEIHLWAMLHREDGVWVLSEMLTDADNREVDRFGLEEGSGIGVLFPS